MNWGFHSHPLRYGVALWLATVLSLGTAFVVQLEPAQWAAITVWIMFIQDPRLNFSKVIWWAFGTVVGALVAVILIALFNQMPELFIVSLAAWLGFCMGTSTFVTRYRAYGWVLAGYTCAIVSMTAAEHPDLVFRFAVTRVSCIFIGMAWAIIMILILLPRPSHWRETLHHLGGHLKASLLQAANALGADEMHPATFTWRHMVDRLSTLEHTLDATTTESAESRIHAAQARSLVATLFCLLARAQAIEVHLSRSGSVVPNMEVQELMCEARALLTRIAKQINPDRPSIDVPALCAKIGELKLEVGVVRHHICDQVDPEAISSRFILDRLEETLSDLALALQDWAGLYGTWTARRDSCLETHRDTRTAVLYGVRIFLAVTLAGVLWLVTQWPSGTQLILFISVVSALLSLVEYAPVMGWAFVKSAVFCFLAAYFVTFRFWQNGNSFVMLALGLGVFLVPAGCFYRNPRLIGSAVVSMLIFYGLSMPANQMDYNISAFLNNGFALVCAACCGFFVFHAVPSLPPLAKQRGLLRAMRKDLAEPPHEHGVLAEQRWSSLMFDRLRMLHRTKVEEQASAEFLARENEALLSLQLGLRQRRLRALTEHGRMPEEDNALVNAVLHKFCKIKSHPASVAASVKSACTRLQMVASHGGGEHAQNYLGALAELSEMALLLETSAPFYPELKQNHVSVPV